MEKLKGKLAFVTGGGSGIGQAICVELVRHGARIAITDFSLERAEQTRELCLAQDGADAGQVLALKADVTSRESLAQARQELGSKLGSVQLLFANAGVTPPQGHATGRPDSDWEFALSVNFHGVIKTVDTFVDDLRQNAPEAHCMISASMGGLYSTKSGLVLGAYIPSKFACVGYALELRKQFDEEGIGISMLCPGLVFTGMTHNSAEVRPSHMGEQAAPKRHDMPEFLRPNAIMPEDAAREALTGLKQGRFYIPTHSTSVDDLREFYGSIITEMDGHGTKPGI